MKFNKNNLQTIVLITASISIIVTMFTLVVNDEIFYDMNDSVPLALALAMITMISVLYVTLVFSRMNPKKYLFLSYCSKDAELAQCVKIILQEQLDKETRQRYELLTVDSISYGENINDTIQKYLNRSQTLIVVLSDNYFKDTNCQLEFQKILELDKKVIPILIDSTDSAALPTKIQNVKLLSLNNLDDQEFKKRVCSLAKDLAKRRIQ